MSKHAIEAYGDALAGQVWRDWRAGQPDSNLATTARGSGSTRRPEWIRRSSRARGLTLQDVAKRSVRMRSFENNPAPDDAADAVLDAL